MKTINYDFTGLETVMSKIKQNQNFENLKELKTEINKFFKDSICKDIIYTKNDKLFFGMCVIPYVDSDIVAKIMTSEDKIKHRFTSYFLEIDSKLLELNLSSKELVAILLHEIGHLINTCEPAEKIQDSIHIYLDKNNDNIDISSLHNCLALLTFAIQDSANVLTSLFRKDNEEFLADEFVIYCGYGKELESAYKKIVNNVGSINKGASNKLLALQWSFRVYKDLGIKRLYAIKTLNKAIKLSGSELQKRGIKNAISSLNIVQNESVLYEEIDLFRKGNEIRRKIKLKGMRSIEDDLYELALHVKNVDEHDDAIIYIRQINNRLSVIDDFMRSEKLEEDELERWSDIRNKYINLREVLSNKSTYDEKYYGLFVQMPNIKSRYEL